MKVIIVQSHYDVNYMDLQCMVDGQHIQHLVPVVSNVLVALKKEIEHAIIQNQDTTEGSVQARLQTQVLAMNIHAQVYTRTNQH